MGNITVEIKIANNDAHVLEVPLTELKNDIPTLLLVNELQEIKKTLRHLGNISKDMQNLKHINGKLDEVNKTLQGVGKNILARR